MLNRNQGGDVQLDRIVEDVHELVQKHRAEKGLPRFDFKPREKKNLLAITHDADFFASLNTQLEARLKQEEAKLVKQMKRCKKIKELIAYFKECVL